MFITVFTTARYWDPFYVRGIHFMSSAQSVSTAVPQDFTLRFCIHSSFSMRATYLDHLTLLMRALLLSTASSPSRPNLPSVPHTQTPSFIARGKITRRIPKLFVNFQHGVTVTNVRAIRYEITRSYKRLPMFRMNLQPLSSG
jgi:hypothetical protein